jgi:hypothetical protein
MIPTSLKHEALCLVLRLPLSRRAWCRGHCCRTAWVLRLLVSRCVGVAAVGIAPRGCCGCRHRAVWVLQLPSSRRTWCHRRCRRAARGGMVAVVAPRVVSQSRRSRHVVLWLWRVSSWLSSSPLSHHHRGWWLGCGRPWRERTAMRPSAKMKLAGKRKTENRTSRVSRRKEHGNVVCAATRARRPGEVSHAAGEERSVVAHNCEAQGDMGARQRRHVLSSPTRHSRRGIIAVGGGPWHALKGEGW